MEHMLKDLRVHTKLTENSYTSYKTHLTRVESLKKFLGVTFNTKLRFEPHISYMIQSATRSFYNLKTLRAHGLTGKSLKDVTRATLIARIVHGASTSVDRRRRAQNRTVLDCERAGLLACVPYRRRRASRDRRRLRPSTLSVWMGLNAVRACYC